MIGCCVGIVDCGLSDGLRVGVIVGGFVSGAFIIVAS